MNEIEETNDEVLYRTNLELVMPVLNLQHWEYSGWCIHRPLTFCGTEGVPKVGYGENSPDRVGYIIIKQAIKECLSVADLERVGLQNLKAREDRAPWSRQEVPFESEMRPLLSRNGDELTASDILDPEFMQQAHDMLGLEEMLVAVPIRSGMMACDIHMAWALAAACKTFYDQAIKEERDAVSPLIFLMSQGQLQSVYAVPS